MTTNASARRRLRAALLLMSMLMVAAACGQKPGVSAQGFPVGAGNAVIDPETGQLIDPETGAVIDPETGQVIDPATGEIISGGTTTGGGGSTGGGETGGESTGGETGGGGDGPDGPEPTGGSTEGVTGDTIKIGLHAPITGAAPVPSRSFQVGKDLYWNYLRSIDETIGGRNVEVVFRNDNFNPSTAVAVCKEMVESEKVFMLVGIAGADQITACARYAATVGVPYMSGGVNETVNESLPNYFALWMSYPQQGPLLADLMVTKLGAGDEKNGIVRFNTPGFQDGHDAWVAAMEERGASVDYDRAVVKTAGATDASTVSTELQQQGIENVYVLTSPNWFIQLANDAETKGYHPQWLGVGLTMTIDTVATAGCQNRRSMEGSRFFSPFPAYVDSNRFDSNFREAGGTDDIMFGLWGISKQIAELLKLPGENLTRERYMYFAERARGIKTGVLPDLSFSPEDHFGANQMHLNRVDCGRGNGVWVTEQAFVSDF